MTAGVIVELPPFPDSDKPVFFRLRKPSILAVAQSGRIPNELLQTLMEANEHGGIAKAGKTDYSVQMSIMRVLCEACLVEPKWSDLQKENIELTDEQMTVITTFAHGGIKALHSFRQQRADNQNSPDRPEVSSVAE